MEKMEISTYNRIAGIIKFIFSFSLAGLGLYLGYIQPFQKAYMLSKSGVVITATIENSEHHTSRSRRRGFSQHYDYKLSYGYYKGELSLSQNLGEIKTIPIVYSQKNPSIITYSNNKNGFGAYFLRFAHIGIVFLIIGLVPISFGFIFGSLNLINRGIRGRDKEL